MKITNKCDEDCYILLLAFLFTLHVSCIPIVFSTSSIGHEPLVDQLAALKRIHAFMFREKTFGIYDSFIMWRRYLPIVKIRKTCRNYYCRWIKYNLYNVMNLHPTIVSCICQLSLNRLVKRNACTVQSIQHGLNTPRARCSPWKPF